MEALSFRLVPMRTNAPLPVAVPRRPLLNLTDANLHFEGSAGVLEKLAGPDLSNLCVSLTLRRYRVLT